MRVGRDRQGGEKEEVRAMDAIDGRREKREREGETKEQSEELREMQILNGVSRGGIPAVGFGRFLCAEI